MARASGPPTRARHQAMALGLEALTQRYRSAAALALDPITVPLAYPDPLDREVAAFVAAHLAYGKVAPMLRAIQAALRPLGPHPAAWLRTRTEDQVHGELHQGLGSWLWRFHTADDLIHWLLAWKRLDAESGGQGMEAFLLPQPDESADAALSRLVQRLRRDLPPSHGTRFSLPDPLEGAACKRWRMFLRWMVRTDWPDLGLWTYYPLDQLVIPLDTHVARTAGFLRLTTRVTPNGTMAQEITEALRRLDPSDPLRFDFPLSHLGILGDCPGAKGPACGDCPLWTVCRAKKAKA